MFCTLSISLNIVLFKSHKALHIFLKTTMLMYPCLQTNIVERKDNAYVMLIYIIDSLNLSEYRSILSRLENCF